MSSIHLVSTFHYDYIYLKGSSEYLSLSFKILDRALAMLEQNPEWKFTIEQVLLLEKYTMRYPEKLPLLRRFAQEKRLCFAPGMWVMPDMNMTDGESLFQQAKYGGRWLHENLGVEPVACWIADCWGHHAQLPQILTQCGYKGYFFWRCMRRDVARNDFLWKGLDGTDIVTHWLAKGYAGVTFPTCEPDGLRHAEELSFTQSSASEISGLVAAFDEYGHDAPVLLCNGGDFRMPQESAPRIVRELQRTSVMPEIRFSTPEQWLQAVDTSRLPRTEGEFNAAFQGTYSSNIRIKQLLWENRERLLTSETFAALSEEPDSLEPAWKSLLTHQFHDSICGTVCDDGLREILLDLKTLKKTLSVPTPDALFNPTLHIRKEIWRDSGGHCRWVELGPLECRAINTTDELSPLRPISGPGFFENTFFRCAYDKNGRLTSLTSPKGKELIDTNSSVWFGFPVLQVDNGDNWMIYDAPLDGGCDAAAFVSNLADPLSRAQSSSGLINRKTFLAVVQQTEIQRSQAECVISQQGQLCFWNLKIDFSLTITFVMDSPLICFRLEIVPMGKHDRLRVAFPTSLKNGSVHHGIPFGIQQRGNSEFPAEGFIHCGANESGMFLLNRGIPGNNVDENGVILLSVFRSTAMEYKCESQNSFAEGIPHCFEYAVLPHDGNNPSRCGELAVVESYLRPLQPVRYRALPKWGALPPNIRISALRKHRNGLFLRIYEAYGNATIVPPFFSEKIRTICCADGLERPLESPRAISEIVMRPFEIKNLILGW